MNRPGTWLSKPLQSAIVLIIAMCLSHGIARAQESRTGIVAAQQAEKAQLAHPRRPNTAEKVVATARKVFIEDPSGFYPTFETVYHGGGLTLGAGYRSYFADNSYWDLKGMYSVKNYKLGQAAVESRGHWDGRLSFGSRVGWRDATQVGYFGLGTQTSKDDRANFRFQETYADAHFRLAPVELIRMRGAVAYEDWKTMEGQGSFPSIETVYTPATAPGLGSSPTYLHSQLTAGIDWRDSAGYTRRGGLYQATFHDYRNNEGGTFSFQRVDADVIQHIPLLRETWVLAMRGRMETTLNNNDLVPYFLLPALGSGSTLRAFTSDRFRDLHSLLLTAEFRWMPNDFMDMAIFYDAGKVASRRSDLDLKNMKSDIGIGARFHGPSFTPLRFDLAVGNEGWKLVISGGAVF